MSAHKRQTTAGRAVAAGVWAHLDRCAQQRQRHLSMDEAIEGELAGLIAVYSLALLASRKIDDAAAQDRIYRLAERMVAEGVGVEVEMTKRGTPWATT